MFNFIKKFSFLLLLSFLLSGCLESLGGFCYTKSTTKVSGGTVSEVFYENFTIKADGVYRKDMLGNKVYGEWLNTGIHAKNQETISFSADGTIVLSRGYGLKGTPSADEIRENIKDYKDYSSLSDEEKQNLQSESDRLREEGGSLLLRELKGNTTDSDYVNNGRGVKFTVRPDGRWVDIFNPKVGTRVYISIVNCNEDSTSKWTWHGNWRYRYESCWFNALGIKLFCKWRYRTSYDVANGCNANCDTASERGCWLSPRWGLPGKGDDTGWNLCSASDTCWNMNGRGLKVIQDFKEEEVGGRWIKDIEKRGMIKLKIADPTQGSYNASAEAVRTRLESDIDTAQERLNVLQSASYMEQFRSAFSGVCPNVEEDFVPDSDPQTDDMLLLINSCIEEYRQNIIDIKKRQVSSELMLIIQELTGDDVSKKYHISENAEFQNYCQSLLEPYSNIDLINIARDCSDLYVRSTPYLDQINQLIQQKSNELTDLSTNYYNEIDQLINTITTKEEEYYSLPPPGGWPKIGQYHVYVKANAWVVHAKDADNQLKACVSQGNPNNGDRCDEFTKVFGSVNSPAEGEIWLKIHDPDDYTDNTGTYSVQVGYEKRSGAFSAFISKIIHFISNTIYNAGARIFKQMTCEGEDQLNQCVDYIQAIRVLLILYIVIYGIMFTFGMVQVSHADLVIRVCKIGIVVMMIQGKSWDFFSNYVFDFFFNASKDLIAKMTGNIGGVNNPFAFLDTTVGIAILSPTNWIKLFSLCFTSISGLIFFFVFIWGIFTFIRAIFHAVKAYCVSFVFLGVLLSVAPIFICFMLFKVTEELYKGWFGLLVRYAMEPVIIIVGLVLINAMLLNTLESLFAYSVCFKCGIPLQLSFPGLSWSPGTLFCIPTFLPWGYDNFGDGYTFYGMIMGLTNSYIGIGELLSFVIFVKFMEAWSKSFASTITSFLTNSFGLAPSLSQAVGLKNLIGRRSGGGGDKTSLESIKSLFGVDKEGVARRAQNKEIKDRAMQEIANEGYSPKQIDPQTKKAKQGPQTPASLNKFSATGGQVSSPNQNISTAERGRASQNVGLSEEARKAAKDKKKGIAADRGRSSQVGPEDVKAKALAASKKETEKRGRAPPITEQDKKLHNKFKTQKEENLRQETEKKKEQERQEQEQATNKRDKERRKEERKRGMQFKPEVEDKKKDKSTKPKEEQSLLGGKKKEHIPFWKKKKKKGEDGDEEI